MRMDFTTPNNTRRESNGHIEKIRAGQLVPAMAVPFRQNEGGIIRQEIAIELDPLAGRLNTPPTLQIDVVMVPVQAIYALANPNDPTAHLTDVIRERLKAGTVLFPLEADNLIAQRCGINPKRINGVSMVTSALGVGYNAAVNYLRRSKYHKADILLGTNRAVTPALLGSTVLQRLNAVLDPDHRINGAVELRIPNMTLPVLGVTRTASGNMAGAANMNNSSSNFNVGFNGVAMNVAFDGLNAAMTAHLNGAQAGHISLHDFEIGEYRDALARKIDDTIRENPVDGPDIVASWAFGLGFDSFQPVKLASRTIILTPDIIASTDTVGVQQDIVVSDMSASLAITFPVPRSELGCIVYTFVSLKPEETLGQMPHPILTEPWGPIKMIDEAQLLDPVPVLGRELDSQISLANETVPFMYTGHNALKKAYFQYGLGRRLDPTTVENKTAIWQYKVPLSVTPSSILYPETLSQFPFANHAGEIATTYIRSSAIIRTPMIEGPTPVEALPVEISQLVEGN